MAEKDTSARLRRAVKENNLFIVRRLLQRADIRNPDPDDKRYTSLAWAAVYGHEETFEFLLSQGHDDEEISKDADDNTILMLLADQRTPTSLYEEYLAVDSGATLRMSRMYYDRYPHTLDWSNNEGKTALHFAALKGNEELVRMLCDLGADFDLADNKGNTPLHYASAWGHIAIVQLLIERGCQFSARNNDGFTPSDYAYSYSTRETLQETARIQYEMNKKTRRAIFQQAAARGSEWGSHATPIPPSYVPSKVMKKVPRMRSGSGTSRTTATSDSGDVDNASQSRSQSSFSASSSHHGGLGPLSNGSLSPPVPNPASTFANPASALSPIANRVRERDADAMEKYMNRNRSGSQGTTSTENRSQNGSSALPSMTTAAPHPDSLPLSNLPLGGLPRRLRPSASAAQLRSTQGSPSGASQRGSPNPEGHARRGTTTSVPRPSMSSASTSATPPATMPRQLKRSTSGSNSILYAGSRNGQIFDESFVGPSLQYAQFPDPPSSPPASPDDMATPTVANTAGRRLAAFHILSKPLSSIDLGSSHRRGMSATQVIRGA
ncbi:ankyrin [Fistulina hepatica ATCC 64428]|nr:ankyrin [Fistulina hepatica ATCC 64428]